MSKVVVIAKITALEGKRDELVAAMGPMIDHVEANEPDTLTYILNVDAADENVLWMYEEYTSDEALAAHSSSEAMKEMGMALRPLAGARPEITLLNPVRGKGL
ncbi:MAG: putative quinol monooxygenase [Ilumatobacter sp.]|nr:antibiotic biosynthesis monooxygenase [bacterium]MDG1264980.1 putative quinol monooxygenase [Ilumatobacter sp.]NKB39759.1 antibiotic biosynthesis monooxygenase [Ilumatobacter sp.]